jgi:hypothetical protein
MSIVDFLYADHERVASFLSQIGDSSGYLKEVSSENSQSQAEANKASFGAKLFGINAGFETGETANVTQDARMVYDPLWTNSLKLIATVEARASQFDEKTPEVGQLRQLSGGIRVFDIGYLPSVVKAPAMTGYISKGQPSEDDPSSENIGDENNGAEIIQYYIGSLPFGIQFLFDDGNYHYWFSLKRQYLSLYDLDIPLKFPQKIPGNWKAIGIIDAAPNDDSMDDIDELPDSIRQHIPPFMRELSMLPENTNDRFGRQDCTFGLSPLMIYRELDM